MGFFVDETKYASNIILVFGGDEENINERAELKISDKKGKTPTVIYIRSKYEDKVNHSASIKIYKNTKSSSTAIVDVPIVKDDDEKYKILEKYDNKICKFVYELRDENKELLTALWDLKRDDPKYDEIINNIINSLPRLEQIDKGKIKIDGVVIK